MNTSARVNEHGPLVRLMKMINGDRGGLFKITYKLQGNIQVHSNIAFRIINEMYVARQYLNLRK